MKHINPINILYMLVDICILMFIIKGYIKARLELANLSLWSAPKNTVYRDRWASGHSRRNIITRIAGASNCLDVIVTQNELITRLTFPFNIFFSGYEFDLLHRIKLSDICEVKKNIGILKSGYRITYKGRHEEMQSIDLDVHNPIKFIDSLKVHYKTGE